MSKVTLKIEGMEALQAAIRTAPDRVKAYAGDAVALTTFAIAQRAKALAPRDTGALQRSITASSRGLTGKVTIAEGGETIGGRTVFGPGDMGRHRPAVYWRFVEFGTKRTAARPFLRPAAEAESEAYLQRFREVGRKLERDFSAGSLL